jgi:aminoglycoside 6'-N-acetyltransferase I
MSLVAGSDVVSLSVVVQLVPPRGNEEQWLALRSALWPDAPSGEHLSGMADALARRHFVRLAHVDGAAVGFVEASRRVDYVNGTSTSPVAFLEGLYVEPDFRRRGVARVLVEAVVVWAKEEGCRELASDSFLANTAAHAVHYALGFEETERVVYFRRGLCADEPPQKR